MIAQRKLNGWRRDSLDHRDQFYTIPNEILFANTPQTVDLRPQCFPVYDQGQIGDCTSHAGVEALRYCLRHTNKTDFAPSRLWVYWYTRFIEGGQALTQVDSGATLRDTIKCLAKYGAPPETEWDYTHNFTERPSHTCDADAKKHLVTKYQRVPHTQKHIQAVLTSGFPFVFGMSVFPEMMSNAVAKTGDVPMPKDGERPEGGHAPLLCGYDTQKVYFLNSWSEEWGNHGFGTLDWDYMLNPAYVGDMWVILAAS